MKRLLSAAIIAAALAVAPSAYAQQNIEARWKVVCNRDGNVVIKAEPKSMFNGIYGGRYYIMFESNALYKAQEFAKQQGPNCPKPGL